MIKDSKNFKLYYIGLFTAIDSIGRTYFSEAGTPNDKAQKVLDVKYGNVKILNAATARYIDQLGFLNIGICPVCGETPIGIYNTWSYSWGWNLGSILNLCEDYWKAGVQNQAEWSLNSKKGCFVASVCYEDFDASEVIALSSFRDMILLN